MVSNKGGWLMIGMKKYLFGLGKMNRVILFLIAFFWLGGCSVSGVGYGLTA